MTGEQIDALVKPGCERVLFKSGGGAYFLESAGDELAMLGVRLVGTDAQSVGCPGNQAAHTVHFCRRILQCWKAYVWKRHRREIIFDRSTGENRGPGRGACACCAGVRLYFLGWGPVKYEAINAAKSCSGH